MFLSRSLNKTHSAFWVAVFSLYYHVSSVGIKTDVRLAIVQGVQQIYSPFSRTANGGRLSVRDGFQTSLPTLDTLDILILF